MQNPNFLLLHVDSPEASAAFYETLLGHPPIETSPTFAMFALRSGIMLGLWSRHTVEPKAGAVGASELAFTVEDSTAVDATCLDWKRLNVSILMEPTTKDSDAALLPSIRMATACASLRRAHENSVMANHQIAVACAEHVRSNWGYAFRFGVLAITTNDLKFIAEAMGAQMPEDIALAT